MTFERYLPRFASVRLVAWWCGEERWSTDAQIAIGLVMRRLRGMPEPKRTLAVQCERVVERLREQMIRATSTATVRGEDCSSRRHAIDC